MRKIVLILGLLLNFNLAHAEQIEKFVNPLFYKTLYGMATKGDTIKITPNSYYVKNYYGYEASAKCELLENKMDKVVLKCLHLPPDPNNKKELHLVGYPEIPVSWIYKFVIPQKEEQVYGNDLRVILYSRLSWEKEEESISYENYVIYTSEEN